MREQDLDWDAKENWHLARESNWKVCLGIDYGYAPDITAFTVSIYNRLAKVLYLPYSSFFLLIKLVREILLYK